MSGKYEKVQELLSIVKQMANEGLTQQEITDRSGIETPIMMQF